MNEKFNMFLLSDLFVCERGTRLTKENRLPGNTPLVTAGYQNEGIAEYISPEDNKEYGDKITIDMFGNAFYRSYQFCCDDNIIVLCEKEHISSYAKLYITTIIKYDKYRYSYGRQYRQKDFNKHEILLPVDENGAPDFSYMEQQIKKLHHKPIKTVIKHKENVINCNAWQEYYLSDLFFVTVSKDDNLQNSNYGTTPYISSSAGNNGLTSFVDSKASQKANTLTIARNGSVGSTFYQPKDYCCSPDDIRILTPKFQMTVYSGLFIKTVIEKEKFKYAYGRKLGTKRINNIIIRLPSKMDGTPDFEFMENYIKSLPFSDRL